MEENDFVNRYIQVQKKFSHELMDKLFLLETNFDIVSEKLKETSFLKDEENRRIKEKEEIIMDLSHDLEDITEKLQNLQEEHQNTLANYNSVIGRVKFLEEKNEELRQAACTCPPKNKTKKQKNDF